ncbi:hypothetical protein [Acinetobacter sp. BWR-L5]|uniref:hypothetical protein n=1 Tax=Acinetobacter sp. BWR-L5 TaxID=2815725 RepID=UPI0031FEC171
MSEDNFNLNVHSSFINLSTNLHLLQNTLESTLSEFPGLATHEIHIPVSLIKEINNNEILLRECINIVIKQTRKVSSILKDNILNEIYLSKDIFNNKIKNLDHNISSVMSISTNLINTSSVSINNIKNFEKKNIVANHINFETQIRKFVQEISYLILNIKSNLIEISSLINELNIAITSERYEFSEYLKESFQRKISQDAQLLFKKIENNSNKIISNYEFEVKKVQDEYSKVLNDFNLLKESFENSEKTNKELLLKLSNYDKKLSENLENKNKDINIKMNEKFSEIDSSCNTKLAEIESSCNTKLTEIESSCNTKIEEIDATYMTAKNTYKQFSKLAEGAALLSLTDNYNLKAKEEQAEYKKFRGYTSYALYAAIGCTILILGIPIVEYWAENPPVNTNYFTVLTRLTISFMFFVLALFFSKQAAKHYECYQENNRTYLQLSSLEPFIANMTPDEQKEIRKGLIPSYFNQGTDGKFAAKGDEVDLPTNIHAIVNRAFDLVGEKKEPKAAENTATDTKASV